MTSVLRILSKYSGVFVSNKGKDLDDVSNSLTSGRRHAICRRALDDAITTRSMTSVFQSQLSTMTLALQCRIAMSFGSSKGPVTGLQCRIRSFSRPKIKFAFM